MNRLTLAIVNEGADYKMHCEVARDPNPHYRFTQWAKRVRQEASAQVRVFDHDYFSVTEMARAVVELEQYYQEHIKEF